MLRKILIALLLLTAATAAFAHCDSVSGPVITTAKAALDKGDVTPVLKWVAPEKEKEIRTAFQQTLKVRKLTPEARELADQYFFETLVRVHREGEGAPYTGIKPAGFKVEEGIESADAAIDSGSLESAETMLTRDVQSGLRARFAEVMAARKHANDSVEAGRHYVHAYVEFIHYVERLHESATTAAGHHGAAESHEKTAELK